MEDKDWADLMSAVEEIQDWFPDGVVFIGGVAVYAHAMSDERTAAMAAYSHDADLMILLSDFADLRDIEVLTQNKRLGKQQFVKSGFEFDVYVEHQNDLPVPTGEAIAFSVMKSGIRVACLEHLIILKTQAFLDRRGTPKGDKDEDDLVRIFYQLESPDTQAIARVSKDDLTEIEKALSGDAPLRISRGNSHMAKSVRARCLENLTLVRNQIDLLEEKKDETPEPGCT